MSDVPPQILGHYDTFDEHGRLTDGFGRLEWDRTLEILGRILPEPPARILDVGGGPGRYAHHLTEAGYEVHLIDPVAGHVVQAAEGPIASANVGDARRLPHPDASFDTVLLLGPLYHLQNRSDRLEALAEASRVVKPGGPIAAAAISRFASAIDGLDRGFIDDPEFRRIMAGDLTDGRHNNDTGNPVYFTTAYFHHPDELHRELLDAGLRDVRVLAVEGIGWVDPDLDGRREDPARWSIFLDLIRMLEREPSLLGASPHLLGIGTRAGNLKI
jgi:ubiquinone/menaquinone biosynthesis C-methylase UbiE